MYKICKKERKNRVDFFCVAARSSILYFSIEQISKQILGWSCDTISFVYRCIKFYSKLKHTNIRSEATKEKCVHVQEETTFSSLSKSGRHFLLMSLRFFSNVMKMRGFPFRILKYNTRKRKLYATCYSLRGFLLEVSKVL